jgi:hypothetical protein
LHEVRQRCEPVGGQIAQLSSLGQPKVEDGDDRLGLAFRHAGSLPPELLTLCPEDGLFVGSPQLGQGGAQRMIGRQTAHRPL